MDAGSTRMSQPGEEMDCATWRSDSNNWADACALRARRGQAHASFLNWIWVRYKPGKGNERATHRPLQPLRERMVRRSNPLCPTRITHVYAYWLLSRLRAESKPDGRPPQQTRSDR